MLGGKGGGVTFMRPILNMFNKTKNKTNSNRKKEIMQQFVFLLSYETTHSSKPSSLAGPIVSIADPVIYTVVENNSPHAQAFG